jgi:UDP-N-acetylglucosamine--N-acetylmuramyl-(pentapeptide) pyrophosphoryl-undecaprenol N-acetylglucosamine transferase
VYPALAVADELTRRGLDPQDIVFFGGDRMESRVVPEAGYPFVQVDIHGIRRGLSLDNVTLPLKVRAARDVIAREIERHDIAVMVVFGGYVAGPAALAASRASIPLIIHEANAVPGVANRLIARKADTIYVAFAPATNKLPAATVIGSPLRAEFTTFERDRLVDAARQRYGFARDELVLGVVGGSQGASFLNELAMELAGHQERAFSVLQVTGPTHYDSVAARAESIDRWVTVPFEESMVDLYAACDVIVCRGGAMTISEIEATSTPAIIVPLPAGKGYQARNATDLVASGGAIVVEQSDVATVAGVVMDVIGNDERMSSMRQAQRAVDHRAASSVMADRIIEVDNA